MEEESTGSQWVRRTRISAHLSGDKSDSRQASSNGTNKVSVHHRGLRSVERTRGTNDKEENFNEKKAWNQPDPYGGL